MNDQRPPDTEGLDYTGQACRNRQHNRCPGYWGDSLRSGKGTRCACPCHSQLDERGSGGGQPPADPPMLFPSIPDPGRFIGPPSRR